jgi:hypothetical protein
MAIIGTNITLSVEKTLGSPVTVTALTKATEGVVTAPGHSFLTGAIVKFSVTAGMVEIHQQACRIKLATTNGFTLEGLDTTEYSTWSAGTVTEVTEFSTVANAQSVSMPNPAPAKIDITTLIDKSKQYAYGLPDAPDGSISGLFDPTLEATTLIKAATKSNSDLAFKIVFSAGQVVVFNANVSGGSGFDLPANAAATTTTAFTPLKDVMFYAS